MMCTESATDSWLPAAWQDSERMAREASRLREDGLGGIFHLRTWLSTLLPIASRMHRLETRFVSFILPSLKFTVKVSVCVPGLLYVRLSDSCLEVIEKQRFSIQASNAAPFFVRTSDD